MTEDIFVDQDRVIEAVKLICKTLEDKGFSQIEGVVAMNACLNTLDVADEILKAGHELEDLKMLPTMLKTICNILVQQEWVPK